MVLSDIYIIYVALEKAREKLDFAPFERLQAGDNLDRKTPIEYAQEIMPKLDPNIALFPPVILDNLSSSSCWKDSKDVCEHYSVLKMISAILVLLVFPGRRTGNLP